MSIVSLVHLTAAQFITVVQVMKTFAWDPVASSTAWGAFMLGLFAVWAWYFISRTKPDAIRRDEESRKQNVLALMSSVLAYAENELTKPEAKRSMPEAKRVYKLLWDDVHQRRTTELGFAPELPLNHRTEQLFRELHNAELQKTIRLTRQARSLATMATPIGHSDAKQQEDAKQLAEHESGEKLRGAVLFAKQVRKELGDAFAVDATTLREATDNLRFVSVEQFKNFRSLWRLVRPVAPVILAKGFLSVLNTVLRAKFHQLGVWIAAIDAGVGGDLTAAGTLLLEVWVGHMLIKLIELPESTYNKRAKAYFGASIRNGVLTAMISQDYEYFDRTPAGVLQDRLNRDADELGENLIEFPLRMLERVAWIVCNLYIVFTQSPPAFFAVALMPVVLMTAFQYFTFKFFRVCNERMRRVEEESVSATSEVLRNVKTVRQLANEANAAAGYARRGLSRRLIGEKIFTIRRMAECFVWCVFDSGLALTIMLGLPYVAAGQMTSGQLMDNFIKLNFHINFCLREMLEELPRASRLLEPIGRICDLLQASPVIEPPRAPAYFDASSPAQLQAVLERCHTLRDEARSEVRSVVSCETLHGLEGSPADQATCAKRGAQLMRLETDDFRSVPVADCRKVEASALCYPVRAVFSAKLRPARFLGKIEFRGVHFSYPTDLRTPVLQGLSFVVEPGAKVALVGPTGCGKSSCMALLQRMYEPQRGQILLDDVPIEEYDLHYLRSRVVIVDQSTVLFSQSIRDNLTYGIEREMSDAEIVQACKDAQAWDFIDEKPDKLLTMLESGGTNLSGGQRQRLAIARAMLRKPDIILLDEATSALDNSNEAKVQRALDTLARRGSALVIAHRLSTVKDSDMIAVVDHGRVVESGTHAELLAKSKKSSPHAAPPEAPTAATGVTAAMAGKGAVAAGEKDAVAVAAAKKTAALPPSAMVPMRQKSAPPKLDASVAAGEGMTYRKLWDAATGSASKLSLSTLGAKIAEAEEELKILKEQQVRMQAHKGRLLEVVREGSSQSTPKCSRTPSTSDAVWAQLSMEDLSPVELKPCRSRSD